MHEFLHEWFHHILPMIPFIFLIFLFIEYIEQKHYLEQIFLKYQKYMIVLASILCSIPQCALPLLTASLYARQKISFGTLVASFIACNDESILLLFQSEYSYSTIIFIILKMILAMVTGFIIDTYYHPPLEPKEIEVQHCYCHHHSSILKGVFKHTFHILSILTITMAILSIILHFFDLQQFFLSLSHSNLTTIVLSLLGFIPGCALPISAFTFLTQNYISFSAYCALLTTCNGYGLVVLMKQKYPIKMIMILIFALIFNALLISILMKGVLI